MLGLPCPPVGCFPGLVEAELEQEAQAASQVKASTKITAGQLSSVPGRDPEAVAEAGSRNAQPFTWQ